LSPAEGNFQPSAGLASSPPEFEKQFHLTCALDYIQCHKSCTCKRLGALDNFGLGFMIVTLLGNDNTHSGCLDGFQAMTMIDQPTMMTKDKNTNKNNKNLKANDNIEHTDKNNDDLITNYPDQHIDNPIDLNK
jgi:hypothetical protein